MSRRVRLLAMLACACLLATACADTPDRTPTPATSTPVPTVEPTPTPPGPTAPDDTVEPTPAETPEPEPALSLDLPDEGDDRQVAVDVAVDVPPDGDGMIVVTVTSRADTMATELVLRWSEQLHDALFPAPFQPSQDRIREGGPPLVQPWTKWVIGPGERGEPAGTISLGYGPLDSGATLEIPLFVTRVAEGPVAFDLQVLAGEAILSLEDGSPAELRVEVP